MVAFAAVVATLVVACGDPNSEGTTAATGRPAARVVIGEGQAVDVPQSRSTRVVDDGKFLAGLAEPTGGGARAVTVTDLEADPPTSATVAVPDGTLATAAWAAGGQLRVVAVRCDELETVAKEDGVPPQSSECLRGHNEWLSAKNPLLAGEGGTVEWNVDAVGDTDAVSQLPVFTFANDSTSFFTGTTSVVRVDHVDGKVSGLDAPDGAGAVGICGDQDGASGSVVAVMATGGDAEAAEPNRRQTFADLAHARLSSDGEWIAIKPHPEWDPNAAVLGGRCVGPNPSLVSWETGETWVLEGDQWVSWGRIDAAGFEPGKVQIGISLWAVSSPDWVAVSGPTGIALLGRDGQTATIKASAPEPGQTPAWGVILEGGTFVGQYGTTAVRGEVVR